VIEAQRNVMDFVFKQLLDTDMRFIYSNNTGVQQTVWSSLMPEFSLFFVFFLMETLAESVL